MEYRTPQFFTVAERASGRTYKEWLEKRAQSLKRQDRTRGNHVLPISHYRKALHRAILRSEGIDEYSGREVDWSLAFTNRNEVKGAKHRRAFAAAPSVDHMTGGGAGVAICRDDTNTAKGCMTADDFRALCLAVAASPPRFCNGAKA